ncbi:response regulator [Paenibacillus filicis]|uniref:Response regulator n=1 Tax=Paenibacillus filicis TaxID=669464 RepID=A0ABU9DKG4_9BACL
MKVLIVDDEEHVREGIMLTVDWKQYGVEEVLFGEDGREALELIERHNPAVLFCDMNMPGMDGTELLGRLRQQQRKTQVIVVSGYDHFSYTHAALLAKGVDYLLKPFRKTELEQALERAIAAWNEQWSHLEKEIETGDKLRRANALVDEQRLTGYFKGDTAFTEDIRRVFSRRGLPDKYLKAALLLPVNRSELLYERFRGDIELLMFSLNNIAHEIVSRYGAHYFCRLDDDQWLLLTSPEDLNTDSGRHRSFVEKIAASWQRTLGLRVLIGTDEGTSAVEQLPEAIAQARTALLRFDLLREEDGSDAATADLPHLSDQRLLLETAVNRKDKGLAASAIGSFTRSVRDRGTLRLKDLQAFTHEANLLLEKLGRPSAGEMKAMNTMMPLWLASFEAWERQLLDLLSSLIDGSGEEGSIRSIEAIRDYIVGHYQEDVTLSSLAARFNFNPWYISRKFKEIYKVTVITYLTELRMDKARMLLANTGMTVSEMANTLGYADENYFSKVFKKHTGLSPLQYRKEHRNM